MLQANTTQTAAAIHDWLKTHVTRYQMPKKIILIDELPMTSIGKVDRKKLRQLYSVGGTSVSPSV
jgi:fatty-acyl-CoA synthase